MSESASIRDVATLAGVAVGTVSNVLNHPDRVREETRSRVQKAIADLNFVRSEAARQLRAGHSRTIGLLVLDVTNPFFTDLARGVEKAASATGLSLMLCDSQTDVDKEDRYLTQLAEQRVQGVLIVPVATKTTRLDALRQRGIPVVLLDTKSPDRSFCSVSVDDVGGGAMATAHLLERGHERIAFVAGDGRPRQVADRLRGARRAIRRAGTPAHELVVVDAPSLTVAGGRAAGELLLGMPAAERPTAAFCANDLVALGLLQVLTRAGARVPDDMAIVGYDDIEFADAAAVPLSSVRQPRQRLGRQAAELLLEEASGEPHEHQQVSFKAELVVRDSSGPPQPQPAAIRPSPSLLAASANRSVARRSGS